MECHSRVLNAGFAGVYCAAEHSLSYSEEMTHDELLQKGLIPEDAIRFASRCWDLGLAFPVAGKLGAPNYISTWKRMLETNRLRIIATFRAFDDSMQSVSMAALLSRSFECRKQDTQDALTVAKALILKLPAESPEHPSLSIIHGKLNEQRFMSSVFGVARDLGAVLKSNGYAREAARRQGTVSIKQRRTDLLSLPAMAMFQSMVAGAEESSLALPAHAIGSGRQYTDINEVRQRPDVSRMTPVEMAAMLAHFPELPSTASPNFVQEQVEKTKSKIEAILSSQNGIEDA